MLNWWSKIKLQVFLNIQNDSTFCILVKKWNVFLQCDINAVWLFYPVKHLPKPWYQFCGWVPQVHQTEMSIYSSLQRSKIVTSELLLSFGLWSHLRSINYMNESVIKKKSHLCSLQFFEWKSFAWLLMANKDSSVWMYDFYDCSFFKIDYPNYEFICRSRAVLLSCCHPVSTAGVTNVLTSTLSILIEKSLFSCFNKLLHIHAW